jgi:hypothetical protein
VAKGILKKFLKRRPSWFWWTLIQLLAAAFAIASWNICIYLFNFPERPSNYEILRNLNRLTPVVSYDPLEAPDGASADAQELLTKFYSLEQEQLAAHNRYFKRNYITNFTKPEVVNYIEGSYRVTNSRALTEDDFFHPGLAVRAQAVIQTAERNELSPYPVVIEILFPLKATPSDEIYPAGHLFEFKYLDHRALILHAAKIGSQNEPSICLSVVPLSFANYWKPDQYPLPLANPDPLKVDAVFPAMKKNREE